MLKDCAHNRSFIDKVNPSQVISTKNKFLVQEGSNGRNIQSAMTSYRLNQASRQSSKQQFKKQHSTTINDKESARRSRRRAQTKIAFIKDGTTDSHIEISDQKSQKFVFSK